jgi:hypothetical protein
MSSTLQEVVQGLDPHLERVIHAAQAGIIPAIILTVDEQDAAARATRDVLTKGRKGETFIWLDPKALRKKLATKDRWFAGASIAHIKCVVLSGRSLLLVNYQDGVWSMQRWRARFTPFFGRMLSSSQFDTLEARMNDFRTMYETARSVRVHLQEHLQNVAEYQNETLELHDKLQSLSKRLYTRLVAALDAEERLARHVAAEQQSSKQEAA